MDAQKPSDQQAINPDDNADALEKPEAVDKQNQDVINITSKSGGLKEKLKKFNIYLVIFIFILLLGLVIIAIAYFQSKSASTTTIKTQNLSQSTLQQLANSDATVGGPQVVLNVESSAVFAGQVLIRQALNVASNLQVSGISTLNSLTVSGNSELQDVNINKSLTVAGNAAIQGSATFSQGIQVNGSGTFSGAISTPELTTPSFQLNGDLTLTHHFIVGGPTPTGNSGTALGSGGTASIGGSDTAGSVSVNTGGGPVAGCFISISFSQAYNQTPFVLVTPVGQAAGGLSYYITRTDKSFSICDATAPPSNASFGFDYFVAD